MNKTKASFILLVAIGLASIAACDDPQKEGMTESVPAEYQSYPFLSSNQVTSDGYRIIRAMDYAPRDEDIAKKYEVRSAMYDSSQKAYMVHLYLSSLGETIAKVSDEGEVIGKFHTRLSIKDGNTKVYSRRIVDGVVFYDDFYIDWFHTGNGEPNYSALKQDFDSMSVAEFKEIYLSADAVHYVIDYENDVVKVYTSKDRKWLILESKVTFSEFVMSDDIDREKLSEIIRPFYRSKRTYTIKSDTFPTKTPLHLNPLQLDPGEHYHEFKDIEGVNLEWKFLQKLAYVKASGAFSPIPRDAYWLGIDYYDLNVNDETLSFKTYGGGSYGVPKIYASINRDETRLVLIDMPLRNHPTPTFFDEDPQFEHGFYIVKGSNSAELE